MNPEPQPSPLVRNASPVGIATVEKLRVLFITEDDPLYVINFFDVFFAECPRDEFEIIAGGENLRAP